MNFPLYLFRILLLPDISWYIVETLCFIFFRLVPRLEQGRRSNSSRTASVAGLPSPPRSPSGERASSSCPSFELVKPQQAQQDPIAQSSIMDEATDPHASPPALLTLTCEQPNSAQLLGLHDSVTLPSTDPLQTTRSHPQHRVVPQNSPPICSTTLTRQPSPYLLETQHMFNHAQNFTVSGGTFTNNVDNSTTILNASNNFMKELLEKTIPGAAFDSSAREPPPRCHPGTRLAILKRCIDFIVNCMGEKKMRWVVGAAGVGKSAIMQSVAESALPSSIVTESAIGTPSHICFVPFPHVNYHLDTVGIAFSNRF